MTIMTPSVIVRSQNVIIMLFVETRSWEFFKFMLENFLVSFITYVEPYSEPGEQLRWSVLWKQLQRLTIFAKHSILGIRQGSEYASDLYTASDKYWPIIIFEVSLIYGSSYSRMDQVKIVEDSL